MRNWSIEDAAHRAEVERLWGLPEGSIPPEKGYPAVELFEAMGRGEMRAALIAATNPAASMPDLNRVQRSLDALELCVVQDCFEDTETARYAHVLLPAAQWGEKTGTMTNSERLVARSPQLVSPPGLARPDWWILSRIGQAMGFPGFDFARSEEVWDEYRALTRGTPCDQWGMTNERLAKGPLQWPCPSDRHPGTSRLYTHRKFPTPDGRARFWVRPHRPPAELPDEEYPLVLTTGRVATQWHTRTRTGKIPELDRKAPEPFVEVHPADAGPLGILHGDVVWLIGRRGQARARAVLTDAIRPGAVFSAFHWGDAFAPDTATNDLTSPATDPISHQPELKGCAIRLKAVRRSAPTHEEDQPSDPDEMQSVAGSSR